jgi:hypothetical protein
MSTSRFPDRLRLKPSFDAERLAQDLERLRGIDWTDHLVKQNYDGDWSAIPLRAPVGATHPVMMIYCDPSAKAFEATPFLAYTSYVREALAWFDCTLQSVRLMRLGPQSVIKEHRDHDLAFEHGAVRLHVPITTNPDVEFLLNGTRVLMEPGSLWYLRLSDRHSVHNRGANERVHLVIDAVANDWLAALFDEAVRLESNAA